MKVLFLILWVLSVCFSASQSQEKKNGLNQRQQLRPSGQVLSRSPSAQVKSFPSPNLQISISPQHRQNLASQSLSRSTIFYSKSLLPKKQPILKSSAPKKLTKLQNHSNKASQLKLNPIKYDSKTQSSFRQPQTHQNNFIQKRPYSKLTVLNRPSPLNPAPLSRSKGQPQKSQSPPNPSVKRVVRPPKSVSNTVFQQQLQLTKYDPDPQTLQKTSLNKPHQNQFVKRRAKQIKPNPKALVQNKPSHTKTNQQPLRGRKHTHQLGSRKRPQPSIQRRHPQLSRRRQCQHPLRQNIPNRISQRQNIPNRISQNSPPSITTTPLTTTIQTTTPFPTQEVTTVSATTEVPTVISSTTGTFTTMPSTTTTSSSASVQNVTASSSSAADIEDITAVTIITELYETTELPYNGTTADIDYIYDTTEPPYYYDEQFGATDSEVTEFTYTIPQPI